MIVKGWSIPCALRSATLLPIKLALEQLPLVTDPQLMMQPEKIMQLNKQ